MINLTEFLPTIIDWLGIVKYYYLLDFLFEFAIKGLIS
jgi:hypothetical protein